MDKLVKVAQEPTGPEWFTTRDVAIRYGITNKQALTMTDKLQREEKLDVWKGLISEYKRLGKKFRFK